MLLHGKGSFRSQSIQHFVHGRTPGRFAGCVTPEETSVHHQVLTAALESQRTASVVKIDAD